MSNYEKYGIHKVTIRDILLRCSDNIDPYINFFYKNEDGDVEEAEVVISPSELYDEINSCIAGRLDIDDDYCMYINVDVIEYINKVLKNPMYPDVAKAMLIVYKEKVLNGEIF